MDVERLEPGTIEWLRFIGNHKARYRFALEFLPAGPERLVIDVACGVGYGAHMIATTNGTRVLGIDRDRAALAIAATSFSHHAVEWRRDDCPALETLPESPCADAIVSLETLEHLEAPGAFLARCRSLLKPDAPLIISTPNQLVTGHTPGDWAHHVREYTPSEFISLLESHGFPATRLYGQAPTPIGQLRADLRAEIMRIRQNPLVRAGAWLQACRGHSWPPPLPEQEDDSQFEVFASAADCEWLGSNGPFVLVAVCPPSAEAGLRR
jgi:SAM-dependent methyltransferase